MWGVREDKVPKYLFGTFCFYLLYFVAVIFYLETGVQWLAVPVGSFAVSLFVLGLYGNNRQVQAYTASILICFNVFAYSLMSGEYTEVFTVFCAAVCLVSFYHIPKANYVMLALSTLYIIYGLVWHGEGQNVLWRGGFLSVMIRIFSLYMVQILLIMLIKRQQKMQSVAEQKRQRAEEAAQAKEDFLVNMSHEIRTPMNAITGMAELALRNNLLTGQGRECLYNIRAAGEDLRVIIDDILDVTKIDSGRLEIMTEEYEITSVVHDAVNVIQLMLGEKQVVLSVDVNPDIPVKLRGDSIRIKQIILNLLTNAVKYTEQGTIHLKVKSAPVEGAGEHVYLEVSVTDTGIGMSQQQLEDLFTKFRQTDSGRARGGSGLGLAISKRLAELMQGELTVVSELGKGSQFTFTVRQEVVDAGPCMVNVSQDECRLPVKKEENTEKEKPKKEGRQVTFTAPLVRILLVDDNKVNLKVAEGLLRPYKMCIETAGSGMQAVELVKERIYDLIFMDHMMPQMDGVEAAKIIRGLDREYCHTVPIIALSANAIPGVKELFLNAGMNDFVAKPIEICVMDQVLRNWLPEDKMISGEASAGEAPKGNFTASSDLKSNPLLWQMEGIDVVVGMEYSGADADLYREVLTDYMDTIEEKAQTIEDAMKARDIDAYTIEVHSLKSTSKSIGAIALSQLANSLEENGKNGEWEQIVARTPALLSMYRGLYHIIMPYRTVREQEAQVKKPISDGELTGILEQLFDSVNMYDSIRAEEIVRELSAYDLSEHADEYMEEVSEAVNRFDYDGCKEKVTLWRAKLQEKRKGMPEH